jgi:hypothetical protein
LKTISVKEAAAALGLTPRAVSYRLEKGQLKGTLTKNEMTGVPEWRIYPNKEILAGLRQPATGDTNAIDFDPNDVIEAESVDDTAGSDTQQHTEQRTATMDFQMLIEQCVRPLVDEVKSQALALAEKDRIIDEQSRQLRLLPDFQKQAEDERKAAELKELEAEALRKQVSAMQITHERAEEARRAAENEMQRLKEEKDAEAKAVQEQLQTLAATVQELQKPKPGFWQKFFGIREHN